MSSGPTGGGTTGIGSIAPGTQVAPGAIRNGQALRVGESVPSTFDPRVSPGLDRPVGAFLYTLIGTVCYQKTGTGATDWTLFAAPAAPVTLTVSDTGAATAPDELVEQHLLTGGTLGAAGIGVTNAVEVTTGAGTTRRIMTDVTSVITPTDAGESAKRVISIMYGGALLAMLAIADFVGLAGLYVGDIAFSNVFRSLSGNFQLFVAATHVIDMFATRLNFRVRIAENQGAVVASGGTLTLGTDGNYFHVSGTTAVNFLTTTNWQAGVRVELYFDGAVTVNHNVGSPPGGTNPFQLVGAVPLAAAAGSKLSLRLDSTLSRWVEVGRSGA